MIDVKGVLERARQRISSPSRWTSGASGRNSRGRAVSPNDTRAVRWCAFGTVCKEVHLLKTSESAKALSQTGILLDTATVSLTNHTDYVKANDNLGRKTMLDIFDLAIKNTNGDNHDQ